jgi:hypothetical protein
MTDDESGGSSPNAEIERWRRIIFEGRLTNTPIEQIVGAVQDIGPDADPRILNPLMKHIADELTALLRRRVWRSHPNEGHDIIDRAHQAIIGAVLRPESADGKALRLCFEARVALRLQDAVRTEAEEKRRYPSSDDEAVVQPWKQPQAFDGSAEQIEGNLYVEQLLALIPDARKRLAWRLHMEGVPITSTRVKGTIAAATGVSGRLVQDWLDELREFLKSKIGDRA